jgi:DNA-binding LacI/PurR family transcriptional regulator
MPALRVLTASEQVANHLREEIRNGTWRETMPGGDRLARELSVGRNTIDAALRKLEEEGTLLPEGGGRRRKIMPMAHAATRPLRVCLLPYTDEDTVNSAWQDVLQRVRAAGHTADFAEQSVSSLSRDLRRLKRLVNNSPADAWVVIGGSRELLGWFAENQVTAFAMAGRMRGVPIAGVKPDKIAAQTLALRRLVELGHRRIVRMTLPDRVTPTLGFPEQAFIDELKALGISTGPYNLPVWDGTLKGFHERLDALFRLTPPTAIFLDASALFIAAQNYLARRGILAPEHVSLISMDPDPYFDLLDPAPTHIQWTFEDLSRRAVRWLDKVARGKQDMRQKFTKARFIEGGTIGPAR